jgi:CRISPR-associated protein Cas1
MILILEILDMRHLLNTLFVLTEDAYLALENENVIVLQEEKKLGQVPLLTLENILYFGYKGASPALMGACAKRNIGLCFLTPTGRFLARVNGMSQGNVLLRKAQYHISNMPVESCNIAKNFIAGKIFNQRSVLKRASRDHPLSFEKDQFDNVIRDLQLAMKNARCCSELETLRGIEGNAAKEYFSLFDSLILQNKKEFYFTGRIKRPPTDKVNAMLSFIYTILAHDCACALESVGLDAYVGFLHRDRPGRESLALDLMEELRSIYADRFVLRLINNRMIKPLYFQKKENGTIWLNDAGRKMVLKAWQERKKETITHPFLHEKLYWGLIPYVQALLLARYLRGDLDEYPAYLWM